MAVLAILAGAAACALLFRPRKRLPAAPTLRVGTDRALPLPVVAGLSASLLALLLVPLPVGAVAAPIAGAFTVRAVRRLEPAAARRRRRRLEGLLPQVIDLMATCLSAGASPHGALAEIALIVEAPMCDELTPFVSRLRLGADPVGVWSAMAAHPQLGVLGRALHRAAESGASVSAALSRLAVDLRATRRASVEAKARTIEVKASLPLGLCLLPAFVLIGVVPLVASSFSTTFVGL